MPQFDRTLKNKKAVFLDLDGTVYLGDQLIPGALSFLDYLRGQGIAHFFLSNNSSRSKQDYVEKLTHLGVQTSEDNIILSTDGLIEFLHQENTKNAYVVGTQSMCQMFIEAGIVVDAQKPDYVVLGFDRELTYNKLKTAALFLVHGVELIATHCDVVCPTPEGPIPDVGAMLALFEKATGSQPKKIFGKPNPEMISHILKKQHITSEDVVLIGDRIYTDLEMSRRVGCDFILVLSGETTRADIDAIFPPPALVAENLGKILP